MDAKDVGTEDGKSVEEKFEEIGTAGVFSGNTESATPTEVGKAITENKTVRISHADADYGVLIFSNFAYAINAGTVVASVVFEAGGELVNASLVGDIGTDTWTFSAEELSGGGAAELPVFDLEEMGLAAITAVGGTAFLETDTAEIAEAFAKGPVKLVIPFEIEGQEFPVDVIMNGFSAAGEMVQGCSVVVLNEPMLAVIQIMQGRITAAILPFKQLLDIPEEKIAASVDLSDFENGTVVETYSDGSTLTYTFEFDSDGKPTKIFDSDGNETALNW